MPTKRKQKGYSLNPLNIFSDDWDFNPRGVLDMWDEERERERQLKVIKGLLAKEEKKAQNKKLGILEHDEGGEYTDEENEVLKKVFARNYTDPTGETQGKLAIRNDYDKFSPEVLGLGREDEEGESVLDMLAREEPERKRLEDEELYSGLLASEELGMYDDSPDKQDMLDIPNRVDDNRRIDNIAQQYEQYRTPDNSVDTSMISTDSSKSKMSPAMKKYAVGLLKDFMTPQEDDPPPQVRGAGIIRGGGTPFPSLLAKRQKPPRYTPKGLI